MDKEKVTGSAPAEYKDNLHGQPLEFYGEKFREADPQEIADRLHLPFNRETGELCIRFLGKKYHISHPDFHITMAEPGMDALSCSDSARILMLRYLCLSSPSPATGEFLSFRDMPGGDLYFKQFQGRCIFRLIGKYGKRINVFREICEKFGAKKVDYADACYDFELFEGLFVRLILWEGDEEFPASAQILFSSNFSTAFETYDLAEIGGILIGAMGGMEKFHE